MADNSSDECEEENNKVRTTHSILWNFRFEFLVVVWHQFISSLFLNTHLQRLGIFKLMEDNSKSRKILTLLQE